jgi:hypothetical protein
MADIDIYEGATSRSSNSKVWFKCGRVGCPFKFCDSHKNICIQHRSTCLCMNCQKEWASQLSRQRKSSTTEVEREKEKSDFNNWWYFLLIINSSTTNCSSFSFSIQVYMFSNVNSSVFFFKYNVKYRNTTSNNLVVVLNIILVCLQKNTSF